VKLLKAVSRLIVIVLHRPRRVVKATFLIENQNKEKKGSKTLNVNVGIVNF